MKSFLLAGTARALGVLSQYVFFLACVNFFGFDGVGEFQLFLSIVTIIGIAAKLGIDNAAFKLSYSAGLSVQQFLIVFFVVVFFVVFSLLIWSIFSSFFNFESFDFFATAFASIAISFSFIISEYLRGKMFLVLGQLAKYSFVFIVAIPILFVGRYWGIDPIGAFVIASIIFCSFLFVFLFSRFFPVSKVASISVPTLIVTSMPFAYYSVISVAMEHATFIFSAHYFDLAEFGEAVVFFKFFIIVNLICSILNFNLLSNVRSLWVCNNFLEARRVARRMIFLNFCIAFLFLLPIYLMSEKVIYFYQLEAESFFEALYYLGVAQIFVSMFGPGYELLFAIDQDRSARNRIFLSAFSVFVFLVFVSFSDFVFSIYFLLAAQVVIPKIFLLGPFFNFFRPLRKE